MWTINPLISDNFRLQIKLKIFHFYNLIIVTIIGVKRSCKIIHVILEPLKNNAGVESEFTTRFASFTNELLSWNIILLRVCYLRNLGTDPVDKNSDF